MSYDDVCRTLAEKHPQDFVHWLLGKPGQEVNVLKTKFSREPIDADAVILIMIDQSILHLEFQTIPASEPPLPLRMADYFIGLYRKYRLPIHQYIIFLTETNNEVVYTNEFRFQRTIHPYNVIRIWEQDPKQLMGFTGLLPLICLAQSNEPSVLLVDVVNRAQTIAPFEEQREMLAAINILAGIKFDRDLIKQLIREDIVKESVTYQEILKKGEQRGLQIGEQRGLQIGEQRGLQKEATNLSVRILQRRFGALRENLITLISGLPVTQIEDLTEASLDFSSLADLEAWLDNLQKGAGAIET